MDLNELYLRAANFCAYTERATSEVKKKLIDWGASQQNAEEILDTLTRENFINEERYAKVFTNGRFRIKKWGRVKIRYALKQKGVSESVIQNALSSIDLNDYLSVIKELAEKKKGQIKAKNQFDLKKKISAFLASKGYEFDLIREALDDLS